MTTIKKINKKKLLYIGCLFLIFNSCINYKSSLWENNVKCDLFEINITKFKLSSDDDIPNIELKNYFDSSFKYDILNYSGKSGEIDYAMNRWYFKTENIFTHVQIINGKRSINEIEIKEDLVKTLFEKLNSISYGKVCQDCYGCGNGLLLIKTENIFFKYHFDGIMFNDLSETNKDKIVIAKDIFQFFNNQ